MPKLVAHLDAEGVLHSPALKQAFLDVDRADFVPEEVKDEAYEDIPLSLFEGQTISQPYTVAFMLEHLDVRPGNVVLDIGYGSGWQTALLAHLVGLEGRVYALEIVPSLCDFGKANLKKYPGLARRTELHCASGKYGFPKAAPFDRIIAAAEVSDAPHVWREQLKAGGRMVYPEDGALVVDTKTENGDFETESFPGFAFVPFVENNK